MDNSVRGMDWTPAGQVLSEEDSATLAAAAVAQGEVEATVDGALVARTLPNTGRSPDDKFVVRDALTADHVWWGPVNRPMEPAHWATLKRDILAHLDARPLHLQTLLAGADPASALPLQAITETAWHALFARNMFRVPPPGTASTLTPRFHVLHAPSFQADPARHGTRSSAVVALNLTERIIFIAGTAYAGEIKKAIFTVMNWLLPRAGILGMHCAANTAEGGADAALFFGLSGTGKTTLSADPRRDLIGDDEHGWSDDGIFNFEGGCYAKVINLSSEHEPEIFAATRRPGTILENVVLGPDARPDFADDSLTENTRASYPLAAIPHAELSGRAGHPVNILLLTCDAYGVLPPLSRLTAAQAQYHFLSGYTARLAGTEVGVTEPKAVFSPCFGGPFLPLPPAVYAALLGEKITRHGSTVWLVNTGWTGGAYGTGKRVSLPITRALVHGALDGTLAEAAFRKDPIFGLDVPLSCPGVPDAILTPRSTWADAGAYDIAARKLAAAFRENFAKVAPDAPAEVREAGPAI